MSCSLRTTYAMVLVALCAACGPDPEKVKAFEASTDAFCSCAQGAAKKSPGDLEEFPCSAEKKDFYDKYSAEFFGEPVTDEKLKAIFDRGRGCEKVLDGVRAPR